MWLFVGVCYGGQVDLHGVTAAATTRSSSELHDARWVREARRLRTRPARSLSHADRRDPIGRCRYAADARCGVVRRRRCLRVLAGAARRCGIALRLSYVRALCGDERAQSHACAALRSEEHTSELQSLMRISYAVFCLKTKTQNTKKKLRIHSAAYTRQT